MIPVLFLKQGAGYVDVFSLEKFIKYSMSYISIKVYLNRPCPILKDVAGVRPFHLPVTTMQWSNSVY